LGSEAISVVVVHESYQQAGGEDRSVACDVDLLRSRGHRVTEFRRHNRDVSKYGRLRLGAGTVWSRKSYRSLQTLLAEARPSLVHFHNTLPLISPSALWAARRSGAAVVMTLRNFRLACPNGLFFRDGHVCRDCLKWPGPVQAVLHRCYRNDVQATAAIVAMLSFHRAIRTWDRALDLFLVLSRFQRRQLVAAGLPPKKLFLRPNFVAADPGLGSRAGMYAFFAGRLAPEKGIGTLLEAWRRLNGAIKLRIAGDGPLMDRVRAEAAQNSAVEYLGQLDPSQVCDEMKQAACLVFPSEWFEALPRTVIEAYAVGLPVLAARIGSADELVRHGSTGLLFTPGDAVALAEAVSSIVALPDHGAAMSTACREEYLERYTAEKAYDRLMVAYEQALQGSGGAQGMEGRREVHPGHPAQEERDYSIE